jgi:hypothetical protein
MNKYTVIKFPLLFFCALQRLTKEKKELEEGRANYFRMKAEEKAKAQQAHVKHNYHLVTASP